MIGFPEKKFKASIRSELLLHAHRADRSGIGREYSAERHGQFGDGCAMPVDRVIHIDWSIARDRCAGAQRHRHRVAMFGAGVSRWLRPSTRAKGWALAALPQRSDLDEPPGLARGTRRSPRPLACPISRFRSAWNGLQRRCCRTLCSRTWRRLSDEHRWIAWIEALCGSRAGAAITGRLAGRCGCGRVHPRSCRPRERVENSPAEEFWHRRRGYCWRLSPWPGKASKRRKFNPVVLTDAEL